ncbi:MAG: hydroxyacid dehydrogenase [Bacteroidales bacterium]|nr:hydroxyacid dehydrogenase [Bacteroidales bacterium]MCF8458167.1 hydroxyacid dehydrogenase [Bacteroidales bacterium]
MKITVIEPIGTTLDKQDKLIREFRELGHEIIFHEKPTSKESEMISRLTDAEVLVLSNQKLPASVIENCPKLKFISVAFTGIDHIDVDVCNEKSILISNAAGYSRCAVAELTVGLIISLSRKITWCDKQVRELGSRAGFLGRNLSGKTIGIIGTGSIGLAVARLSLAFNMRVLAFSRTKKVEAGINYVDLDYLLTHSDFVSLHLPLTESTKEIIGADELVKMKPEAILINTARGQLVDNNALANALIHEEIAGVGIDVYEEEPPIPANHPLLKAPNTILLPHIGFATEEAIARRTDIVFENIRKWLEGSPQNIVG